jgi:aryl-alcohol dehydrogenase-like predicted oxidoreductase
MEVIPVGLSRPKTLERRTLGRSGLEVSVLGLGGAGLGGQHYGSVSEAQAIETVQRALESGINYIDTSPAYGESERRIGLALDGVRERVVLSSKTGTHPIHRGYDFETTHRSVENSLRQMRTDHIDLLLIHDPNSEQFGQAIGSNGALEALEQLKAQGVIRAIGLGVRDHALHLEAIKTQRFDALLTFLDYTLLNTSAREVVLPNATEGKIGVINGSALAMGLLSGNQPRSHFRETLSWAGEEWPEVALAQELWWWAQNGTHDLKTYALQFSLLEPQIHTTLVGAKTPEEIEQIVQAISAHTSSLAWQELHRIRKVYQHRQSSEAS